MDRINFGEEKDEKGFCIGSIDEKGRVDYEFIPLPVRKMLTLNIKIEDSAEPTKDFIAEIEEYDLKAALVRVSYEATDEANQEIDFKKVREALKEAFLVTGISRNTTRKAPVKRSTLSEEMNLFTALKEYIDLQNWQNWDKDLISYAKKLEQELFREEVPSGGDEI